MPRRTTGAPDRISMYRLFETTTLSVPFPWVRSDHDAPKDRLSTAGTIETDRDAATEAIAAALEPYKLTGWRLAAVVPTSAGRYETANLWNRTGVLTAEWAGGTGYAAPYTSGVMLILEQEFHFRTEEERDAYARPHREEQEALRRAAAEAVAARTEAAFPPDDPELAPFSVYFDRTPQEMRNIVRNLDNEPSRSLLGRWSVLGVACADEASARRAVGRLRHEFERRIRVLEGG